jgi:hypothetical protein
MVVVVVVALVLESAKNCPVAASRVSQAPLVSDLDGNFQLSAIDPDLQRGTESSNYVLAC